MPERKPFFWQGAGRHKMSQLPSVRRGAGQISEQKNDPEKSGPQGREFYLQVLLSRGGDVPPERIDSLKTGVGRLAVADGDHGARHQQTIDGGHEAAKQGGGRRKAERSSLGHLVPLSRLSGSLSSTLSRHARCQQQSICLHGSIFRIATQHKGVDMASNKKAAGNRRPTGAGKV